MTRLSNSQADWAHFGVRFYALEEDSQPLKRIGLELIEKRIHGGIIAPNPWLRIESTRPLQAVGSDTMEGEIFIKWIKKD